MQLAAPAIVRPRCYASDSGDVVLLEDEVRDFAQRHDRGVIEISGAQGTGKTTALECLASLPELVGVRLADDAPPTSVLELALSNVVICTYRIGSVRHHGRVDLSLQLAPWGEDEAIEYLLSAQPAACASVMQRLMAAGDWLVTEGVPEVARLVLDSMACDVRLAGAKEALRSLLQSQLFNPHVREQAGSYAWTLQIESQQLAQRQLTNLIAAGGSQQLRRLLHWPAVQRMLAAGHLFTALAERRAPLFLACVWPRDLLEEVAQRVRSQVQQPFNEVASDIVEHLVGLADRDRHCQAMAASLLHAAGQPWRPRSNWQARLDRAVLDGISWSGVALQQARLRGASLCLADLAEAKLDQADALAASFRGAVLQKASMKGVDATRADFSQADLRGADCKKANFYRAMLVRVCCEKAKLSGADFGEADLTAANFSEADLSEACLVDATLDDADFSGARLDGANLSGMPLNKATWEGARFVGAKLRGANLEDVAASSISFERADLQRAHLTGSRFPHANFRGANLRGTGLADIHWERADLREADLRGCTFHMGSTRSGLLFTPYASEGTRTGFYTDDFEEQYFKRPEEIRKANLRGADLRGARIDNVDFYLVDLRAARYSPDQADHFRRCRAILE